MALTLLFSWVTLALPPAPGGNGDILKQLNKGYEECTKKPPMDVLPCRKSVYVNVARVYCKNQIHQCNGGHGEGGFEFMDPKRCFFPEDCRSLPNGDVKLSYQGHRSSKCHAETQRAELSDPYNVSEGVAMEYKFNMTLPEASSITAKGGSILITQFKASGGNSPPFALRYKSDGRLVATVRHNRGKNGSTDYVVEGGDKNGIPVQQVLMNKVTPGKPMNIVVQVKAGDPGYTRVKIDGKVLWAYDGPLGYKGSNNYFKIGPYDHSCMQKDPFAITFGKYQRSHVIDKIEAPASSYPSPEEKKDSETIM